MEPGLTRGGGKKRALLLAHIALAKALGGPEFYDCDRCTDLLKQSLGHEAPPVGLYTRNLLTDEPFALCPLRQLQLDPDPAGVRELVFHRETLHPLYRQGRLLTSGGVADQPARYMAWMREFDDLDARSEVKRLDVEGANRSDG